MLKRLLIVALLGSPVFGVAKATNHTKSHSSAVKKLKIKDIRFVGNHKLSSDVLGEHLINKTPTLGIMGGELKRSALKTDAMIIRDVYYQHGYLDAMVGKPSVGIDPKSGKAIVTYKIIKEGTQYRVSSVKVKGSRVAVSGVKLKAGDTFNVQYLRDDLATISKSVGSQGYAFAQVKPLFRKNGRNKTISVVYAVSPGRKGIINDIKIKGNTKTDESVIRSYITLAPGDQFNLNDLIKAQDQLNRTGFFESVSIRPVPVRGSKVDLEVNVKEAKTNEIMGAAGYDSLEGFFVEGSFSSKNIMGSGIALGISGSYSKMKKNGSLFFNDPRVAGTLFGLYGGIDVTDYTDDSEGTYGYDKREYGGYLGVSRQITDEIKGSIDYSYRDVRYRNYAKWTAKHPDQDLSDYIKSAVSVSLTFNNTDNYYVPTRGIYAKAKVEYAGFGSGDRFAKFVKSSLKFAAYYGLEDQIGYDVILRYKMQAAYIHDLGFTPDAEKLRIGGYYRGVRGYRGASIHPESGGGMKSMVNSAEVSVGLSKKQKIRLTAFADYGMIGNKSVTEVKKKSVGVQLEWRSPLGDVNFILAKAIGAKKTDQTTSFEFTIGKEF